MALCIGFSASASAQSPAPEGANADAQTRSTRGASPPDIWLDLVTRYDHLRVGQEEVERFTLPRAEFGIESGHEATLTYRFRVEALRAAGPESAFGVDGDSILLRVRQAHVGVRHRWSRWLTVEVDIGLVGSPWVRAVEPGYDQRGLAPLRSEAAGLFFASDLGLATRFATWDQRLSLGLSYLNGEGRNRSEQNTGKNLSASVTFVALRMSWLDETAELSLHGLVRDGSRGIASARDHRRALAVSFAHPRLHAGGELTWGDGLDAMPDRRLRVGSGWVSAIPWDPWLGVVAQAGHTDFDRRTPRTSLVEWTGGLFTSFDRAFERPWLRRARVYVTYSSRRFERDAAPVAGGARAFNSRGVQVTFVLRTSQSLATSDSP